MKVFTWMKFMALVALVVATSAAYGQTTIYSEDFTGQNGKGAVGPTPTIDLTGVDWTIDVSGADLSATSDWFQVQSEIFEGRDLDGVASWFSPSIDISTYTNVSFTLEAVEDGTMEAGDIFETFYRIDGGAWTAATTNGELNDDFTSATVSQTGLSGSTLEIRVDMNNNAGTEYHRLDDVVVQGTSTVTTTSVQFSPSTYSLDEDGLLVDVCVSITNPDATNATTVEIALDGGSSTATNGTDYDDGAGTPMAIAFPVTLTFPAGSSTDECLTIYISNDDMDIEGDETIVLDLQNAAGGDNAAIGGPSTATVTIVDNDALTINPGDIVINEFMANPDCEGDAAGEYVELYNTTGTDIDIEGWIIEDDGTDSHTFSSGNGSTIVPAGGYLLCAISSSMTYFGFSPAYVYSGFNLANGTDEIVLDDGTQEICRVNYGSAAAGVAQQLPEAYDYSLADDGVITAGEFVAPDSPFGCGDLGTPGEANILPVNLLAFNAKEFGTEVLLSFSTTSEQNNSHFLIQRSLDGRTFETIGRVEGKGDSNEQVDYSFVDAKPAAGLNYYRLQQFDFDGTNAFFGPVAVRFGGAETTKPQVWPVPATDVLQVELPAQDASWNLEVFTINGQLLLEKVVTEKGAQTSFDISALPAGSYFLRWANGREMGQIRFVKQ